MEVKLCRREMEGGLWAEVAGRGALGEEGARDAVGAEVGWVVLVVGWGAIAFARPAGLLLRTGVVFPAFRLSVRSVVPR